MYKRYLKIDLPKKQSAFFWGSRKTGKTTLLKERFPSSIFFDLLKTDLFLKFSTSPQLLREQVLMLEKKDLQQPIIIDEVQKIPALLDEVHWLIENTEASFILCSSSARKLRRAGVNLLGGRAWSFYLHPLVSAEVDDFDLLKSLQFGTIPSHYTATHPKRSLKAYVQDYLTLEIQAESLVRNLPAFAKFLASLSFCNTEMINYANIARDCAVSPHTIKEYFQILIDTLVGYYVWPYKKEVKRSIIAATPKFYFFDVGIANSLTNSYPEELKGPLAGKALENFIFLELLAFKNYHEIYDDIFFWRTKTGLEVDFVFQNIPIEVKISANVSKEDLKGLFAFCQEHNPKQAIVVSNDAEPRKISDQITVVPYKHFLQQLWAGKIFAKN